MLLFTKYRPPFSRTAAPLCAAYAFVFFGSSVATATGVCVRRKPVEGCFNERT
jgi:hypothetical protein